MKNRLLSEAVAREKMILKLYITGMSENSLHAVENIREICGKYPKDFIDLEIIDIYKNPSVAEEQKIIFSPSLIRQYPLPVKTLIGDLSDIKKVTLGLGIAIKE